MDPRGTQAKVAGCVQQPLTSDTKFKTNVFDTAATTLITEAASQHHTKDSVSATAYCYSTQCVYSPPYISKLVVSSKAQLEHYSA